MKALARVCVVLMFASGAGALVLGLLLWVGRGWNLVPVHVALGLVVVVALWALAAAAWRGALRVGTVAFAILWGLGTVALGLTQGRFLPGSYHWVVAVLHLASGGVAIGLGRILATTVAQGTAARVGERDAGMQQ
jgi:hypothetical protein